MNVKRVMPPFYVNGIRLKEKLQGNRIQNEYKTRLGCVAVQQVQEDLAQLDARDPQLHSVPRHFGQGLRDEISQGDIDGRMRQAKL